MTDSYLFFGTSSHQQLAAPPRARRGAARVPAVVQRHRLASRLRRVADRLDD